MCTVSAPSNSRKLHGQYYTKTDVCRLLVASVRQHEIGTALELGAGEGALIAAAHQRWPSAHFVSVDIDPRNAPVLPVSQRSHFVTDALRHDLPARIGVGEASADLALCNPPFALPRWERRYQRILARAGLPTAGAASFGADAFFIAQNLWMLRERGELGVIVPAGLVAGSRSQAIREALLAQHEIHQIVELPAGAFSNTEVRTYLLCLQKGGGSRRPILLKRFETDGVECASLSISAEQAARRMDYSHYQSQSFGTAEITAAPMLQIYRGNVEVGRAQAMGVDVLHTTDLQSSDLNWRRYRGSSLLASAVRAKRGDVLLARVGRRFFSKISRLTGDNVPISDCVFAIRSEVYTPSEVFAALTSDGGQRWLEARARGACARYITKEDLQMFPIAEFLS